MYQKVKEAKETKDLKVQKYNQKITTEINIGEER